MEFYAYHGCLESERRDGNRFSVNLEFDYDSAAAAESDDLEKAVNYAEVFDIVSREMAIPSNLLENVTWRILQAIHAAFPQITFLNVAVTKYNPPVAGKCGSSTVSMTL